MLALRLWFTGTSIAEYTALGDKGQINLVIPGSDLVVVMTANTREGMFLLIGQYVLPAMMSNSINFELNTYGLV